MALAPGATLGPYDIIAPIGAGGMEVYPARDRRLQREMAVKILKSDQLIDQTTRERFQREARSVAALNHPPICAVYDVGVDAGNDYIVMESIEGETLDFGLARPAAAGAPWDSTPRWTAAASWSASGRATPTLRYPCT